MSEPVETTLEEARRCPKCERPGAFVKRVPARGGTPGAMLHEFECRHERCQWFGQICRIVQVNPDGSIPPATTKRDKSYPKVPDLSLTVNANVEAMLHAARDPRSRNKEV